MQTISQAESYNNRRLTRSRAIFIQREKNQINDISTFDKKKINRKKWFTTLANLTCLALFLWQTGMSVKRYLDYPVGTKRTTTEEKITYLPSISICNNDNRFRQAILVNEVKNEKNVITEADIENAWIKYGVDRNKIRIYRPCNEYQTDELGSDVNVTSFYSLYGRCVDVTLVGCSSVQGLIGMDIQVLEHENIQFVQGYGFDDWPYYNIYPHVTGELDIRKIYGNLKGIWRAQLSFTFEKREVRYLNARSNPCVSIDEHIKCHEKYVIQYFEKYAKCKIMSIEKATIPYCTSWRDVYDMLELYNRWQLFENKFQNYSCIRPCKAIGFKLDYVLKKARGTNTLKLEITMADAIHEILSEYYMYPFTMLINDLSGVIGFFLGVSLISLFQDLEKFGTMLTEKLNKLIM